MTSNPATTTSESLIEEAAFLMGEQKVRRLPVVDNGRLTGMLSFSDLSRVLALNDSIVAQTIRQISTPYR